MITISGACWYLLWASAGIVAAIRWELMHFFRWAAQGRIGSLRNIWPGSLKFVYIFLSRASIVPQMLLRLLLWATTAACVLSVSEDHFESSRIDQNWLEIFASRLSSPTPSPSTVMSPSPPEASAAGDSSSVVVMSAVDHSADQISQEAIEQLEMR